MPGSNTTSPDFWLGDRSNGVVTDFDGRLRACMLRGQFQLADDKGEPTGRSYFWLDVEPPIPLQEGGFVKHIAVLERDYGADLTLLESEPPRDHFAWLPVRIFRFTGRGSPEGSVPANALVAEGFGEIAREPGLLPPSNEDQFEMAFRLLRDYVHREHRADVPLDHLEDGIHLGVWVDNMRFEEANHGLRADWKKRLGEVPGWKWLPGDDFALLEQYARREGHTRMPIDHVEQGRPIGPWVRDLRETRAAGHLAPEWIARLEQIPGWEW
jgi:hypothetical protein